MKSGFLAIFSPVSLTPEVRETVASQGGNVRYIIAPDMEHHINVTAWKRTYPGAEIIAPEGLWEKRQKQNPNANANEAFDHIFTRDNASQKSISTDFDSEFDTEYVYGHVNRELVFLHKQTKTLIEADLLFNMPAKEQYSRVPPDARKDSILDRVFSSLMMIPSLSQRRFAWYLLSTADSKAFTKSIRRIDRWDFDRLIPCHGDVIETGAKGAFEDVMAWFLNDKNKSV